MSNYIKAGRIYVIPSGIMVFPKNHWLTNSSKVTLPINLHFVISLFCKRKKIICFLLFRKLYYVCSLNGFGTIIFFHILALSMNVTILHTTVYHIHIEVMMMWWSYEYLEQDDDSTLLPVRKPWRNLGNHFWLKGKLTTKKIEAIFGEFFSPRNFCAIIVLDILRLSYQNQTVWGTLVHFNFENMTPN